MHDQNRGAEKRNVVTKIKSRLDVLKMDKLKIVLVIK
jgi:hypothetical protein